MSDDKDRVKRRDISLREKRQAALATKVVSDLNSPRDYDAAGNRKGRPAAQATLTNTAQRTASIIRDVDSMMQLLPDIQLSAHILVSSILSPKDMGAPELAFHYGSDLEDQDMASRLIKIITDYFTEDYKINDSLSSMLHQILFETGSYAQLIVPESSLDQLINSRGRISLESISPYMQRGETDFYVRPLGILGDDRPRAKTTNNGSQSTESSMTLESFINYTPEARKDGYADIGEYITVIDNPDAVKMSKMFEKLRKDHVKSAYAEHAVFSIEKYKKSERSRLNYGKTDREIEERLDAHRDRRTETYIELKTASETDRENIGHPMVMKLPSECVIPAHVPSDPERHIGYFVLLDQFGNPLNMAMMTDHYQDLQQSFQNSNNENILKNMMRDMRGGDYNINGGNVAEQIQQSTQVFSDIIERSLLKRLRSGVGHGNVELGRPSEVYEIMFARTLQRKRTQMLFVPSEMMSYMAFYYNKNGVGKSLLEETRVLGSMRVVLMFANTMAAIRNSTSRTELGISFDPEDTDPLSTASQVKDAFMRARAESFPLGEGSPSAIIDYLQKAAVDVVYSGHEGLPNMQVTTSDKQTSRTIVDRDLDDALRRQHIMGLGLSPETVDTSANIDFATTAVQSSLLLSKRVAIYQARFEVMLSDFIQKFTKSSETLFTKLKREVNKHNDSDDKLKVESDDKTIDESEVIEFIEDFIDSIYVSLPRPDALSLQSKMAAFDEYTRSLEEALNAYISDEFMIHEEDSDLRDFLSQMKNAVKALYQRRWLRDNNMLSELEELTVVDDDGKPSFDFDVQHSSHVDAILANLDNYIERARERRHQRMKRQEEDKQKYEEVDSSEATGDTDETSTTDDGVDNSADDELSDSDFIS